VDLRLLGLRRPFLRALFAMAEGCFFCRAKKYTVAAAPTSKAPAIHGKLEPKMLTSVAGTI
jgi:hypothetical protein